MDIKESNFILHLKNHDEKALDYVIDKYGWVINSIVKKELYNLKDYQEECINDILLGIWNNIESFDENKSSFKSWVGAIAKYKTIDYKRKYLKRREENIDELNLTTEECISDNITHKELSKEIDDLLDNLSEQDRQLFTKLYVEEKEVEEVSKEMNLNKSNIYNRISRGKSKLRKLFNKYTMVACIFIMAMFLFNENTISYAKDMIENITYSISKALGLSSNLDDYKTILNKSISKNGLEVKIEEVVLNNDEIIFTYIVKSDKKFEEVGYPSLQLKSISINNKRLGGVGGGTGQDIDEYTQENVMSFTLLGIDEDELKKEVDIKIEFDQATLGGKVVKGPWVFKFKADGKQLSMDTKEININKRFKLEGGAEIVIERYTKNDLGEKIYARIENYDDSKSYGLYLKGVDESDTEVRFMGVSSSGEAPILERFDESSELDAKSVKLRVYAAEVDSTYTPMNSDYKPIGEEFTIGSE